MLLSSESHNEWQQPNSAATVYLYTRGPNWIFAISFGWQNPAPCYERYSSSNPETFNILRSKLIAAGKACAGSSSDYAQFCRSIPFRPGITQQYSAGCLQSFLSRCAKKKPQRTSLHHPI